MRHLELLACLFTLTLCACGGAVDANAGAGSHALAGDGAIDGDAKPPIDTGDPTCNEGIACSSGSGCGTSCSSDAPCTCEMQISCECGVDGKLHCHDACDVDAAPPPDPCAGKDLPACPPKCAVLGFEDCGSACSPEGSSCMIDDYGDQKACVGGKWACEVHAPLGGPGTCNQTCR